MLQTFQSFLFSSSQQRQPADAAVCAAVSAQTAASAGCSLQKLKKKKSLCKNKGSAKTKAFTASGPSRDKVQDQWGMPGSPLRNLRVPAGMKEITEAKECGSKKALTTSDECDALPLTQGAWSLCCSYLVSEGPFQLVFRRDLAHSSWM